MKVFLHIAFVLFSQAVVAGLKNDTIAADYTGGDKALKKYIKSNLSSMKSMRADVSGCGAYVLVSLDETSRVTETKQTPQSSTCENAVKEELNKSDKWKTASVRGKSVSSQLFYHLQFWKDSVKLERISLSLVAEMMAIDREIVAPAEYAPVPAVPADPSRVYAIVEEMPQFPGDIAGLMAYLKSNIVYPKIASDNNLSGKSFIKFVITATGKVENAVVLKGMPGCPECDQEALRVVKMMPDWKPGKVEGRAVNSYFNLPVSFKP